MSRNMQSFRWCFCTWGCADCRSYLPIYFRTSLKTNKSNTDGPSPLICLIWIVFILAHILAKHPKHKKEMHELKQYNVDHDSWSPNLWLMLAEPRRFKGFVWIFLIRNYIIYLVIKIFFFSYLSSRCWIVI